jgi:hypothetical protein
MTLKGLMKMVKQGDKAVFREQEIFAALADSTNSRKMKRQNVTRSVQVYIKGGQEPLTSAC